MCGIAGICHLSQPEPVSLDLLKQMLGILSYRGPDESGLYADDWVGLGHVRLSIIDLSGGCQPIHNEDETLWIIYNGETFNYPELRQSLMSKGHRFYTSTDTEVIVHLYEEKGSSCLDDLNGQFAFAIWDSKKKKLFLARDRFGILPLYYTIHNDRIIFASEIKSIFMASEFQREIDPMAIDQIFTFWTPLPGRTLFRNVYEIPPGHYLTVSERKIDLRKYWDPPFFPPSEHYPGPFEEVCERLLELIEDAIRIRLRADVPVGCYVSGGLDSSGIAALVRKRFTNRLRTFGIRFEEEAFDEGEYQDHLVSFLQTDHTNIRVTNEEISTSFAEVLWHCEKPLLRTAPVPLFLLAKTVRENGFKVVVTGEGADEVFGGYNIFREMKARRFWARHPDSKFRPVLIRKLYPYIFKNHLAPERFLQSFFGSGLDKTDDPLFSHLIRWQNTGRIKTFFSEDLKAEVDSYSGYEDLKQYLPPSYRTWDDLSKAQYLEILLFMSNYLLSSQGDRVAMAHAVETRPPYLDHRIIDFMGRIPPRWKISGLHEKHILKKTFESILPERILRRPKQPYRAPIRESLLSGSSPYEAEFLSDHSLEEARLFDLTKVKKLLNKLKATRHASEVDSMALAGILSSQILYEQFITHFPASSVNPICPAILFDRRLQFKDNSKGI
jgi:asparagine synthase (glutamine-hydrolysing)